MLGSGVKNVPMPREQLPIDITSYLKQLEKTSVLHQEPSDRKIQQGIENISKSMKSIDKEFSRIGEFFKNKGNAL